VGLFQLGGNLVASISSVKGNWWSAESSTCLDVASRSSRRETSTWRYRRGSSLLRPGCCCSSGRELSPSAWTFLLCCAFSILSSILLPLVRSGCCCSSGRELSPSAWTFLLCWAFLILSSILLLEGIMGPSWLTGSLSWLFLVVTIAA